MKITEILSRFQDVKRNGDGWMAKCPAHVDHNPSLSIKQGNDGRTLLHCFAGCRVKDICDAIGITTADLFDGGSQPVKEKEQIVAIYPYHDADGTLLFQVVRYKPKNFRQRRPDPDHPGEFIWKTRGVKKVLFRLPETIAAIKKGDLIYLCEGEKDVLKMVEKGFSATCNPGGADKWQDSYTETLRNADVVIIADKDDAGRKHAQLVASKLHGVAKSIRVLELPDVKGKPVKDAADFFEAGGDAEQIRELVKKTPQWTPASIARTPEPSRPLRLEPPETQMDFNQWQEVISTNFPALAHPTEICASVVAQLLLNDVTNPFALVLVDMPSSGKTIVLNFFNMPDLAYTTDSFTPASFVSHASNVKREELPQVDLLPRIRFRTLIVRDLAPLFGAKEEELRKTMGLLTRVLDGEGLEIDSGVHGKRGYIGDYLFMMLAATTPVLPNVFDVMSTLGNRLFFLALHSNTKSEEELVEQNCSTPCRNKEQDCRQATELFLRSLWAANPDGVDWNKNDNPDEVLRIIARCSLLLAKLRGRIEIQQSKNNNTMSYNQPMIEKPDRINCQLYNLARGHALICGRSHLTKEDLAPVLEVTFDSAPTSRSKVFRKLLEHGGKLKTSDVEEVLQCSKPTALKEMETLAALGVAKKMKAAPEKGRPQCELWLVEEFKWFATDECKALLWGTTAHAPVLSEDQAPF